MHKYLRSIGFSKYVRKYAIDNLLSDVEAAPAVAESLRTEEAEFVHYSKHFSPLFGLCVCGEKDESGTFSRDFYFPYLLGEQLTSTAPCTIMRHSNSESYSGFCEETGLGISLIFYLQNPMDFMRLKYRDDYQPDGVSLILTGLSTEGKILFPVQKTPEQIYSTKAAARKRNSLIEAARHGDEDAIEDLTMEDIDLYAEISRRMMYEDIYSIVDSTIMPRGVECDHYLVMGDIREIELVPNELTGEEVYILTIESYDLHLRVGINKLDLLGEPAIGRRFKGEVWLQGLVEFPGQGERLS